MPAMRIRARTAVRAVAWARVVLGAVAVLRPELPSTPWVGAGGSIGDQRATAVDVLGRALGGRDIALGAGLLLADRRHDPRQLTTWVAAGAFADLVDTLITVRSWRRLPAGGRVAVVLAAGGASALGALGARDLFGSADCQPVASDAGGMTS